jgi:DNA-binding NtrC family response regulator
MKSVLVVLSDVRSADAFKGAFPAPCRLAVAATRSEAVDLMSRGRFELLFIELDLLFGDHDGRPFAEAIRAFKERAPSIEVVVVCNTHQIRAAVKAVKEGASDYLTVPVLMEEVRLVTDSIETSRIRESELEYLRDQYWDADLKEIFRTNSPEMRSLFEKIKSVAPTKTTVLMVGETGTGKSVLAQLIHKQSNRLKDQFISVHCGAIPDTLLESELFGHEKGAFTGAIRKKPGKFEIARGGTIFLDEIGTVSPSAQIKLLQVLQDGNFSRVGGEEILRSGARVIAATNADLAAMCQKGDFRQDLYYRLNVFPIDIPPLRRRVEDIPLLVEAFLRRLNEENQKAIAEMDPKVMEAFSTYHWPGNIRELENLVERAYILEKSSRLTPESFPSDLFQTKSEVAVLPVNTHLTLSQARQKAVEDFERQYLKALLTRHNGRIAPSAAEAGISTRQLNKLMTRHGLKKEAFKPRSTGSAERG